MIKLKTDEEIELARIEQDKMFQELDDAVKNMKVESEVSYEI